MYRKGFIPITQASTNNSARCLHFKGTKLDFLKTSPNVHWSDLKFSEIYYSPGANRFGLGK